MKIAVVVIGNIRTWEKCKQNFKEIFEPLNPDYFFSTYDIKYNYHPYIKGLTSYNEDTILSDKEINDNFSDFDNKIVQIDYWENVQKIINEENKKFHESMKGIDSCYSQYRKLKKSLELVEKKELENNFNYDYIIKTRYDIIHNKFNLVTDNTEILIDSGNIFPNDCFFMVNRNDAFLMSNYMYDEFYNPIRTNSNVNPPHGLLHNSIKQQNLSIRKERIMDYVIRATMIQRY